MLSKNDNNHFKERNYFSFGVCYTTFISSWFFIDSWVKYKKYYLKYNGELESYEYGSFGVNLNFNIKDFLIGFLSSLNVRVIDTYTNSSAVCVGLSLGYLFRLKKNILLPIRLEFEYFFPGSSDNRSGSIYGAYLRADVLFNF